MRFVDPRLNSGGSSRGDESAFSSPAPLVPHTPGQAWVEERTRVAVSRNIKVSGRLIFQEPVRVEGNLRGDISSSELVVISEGGMVDGRVRTPRVLVLGELQGDIVGSKSVVIGPRARVEGTIEAESLTVCEGAHFEGDVRMRGLADADSSARRSS